MSTISTTIEQPLKSTLSHRSLSGEIIFIEAIRHLKYTRITPNPVALFPPQRLKQLQCAKEERRIIIRTLPNFASSIMYNLGFSWTFFLRIFVGDRLHFEENSLKMLGGEFTHFSIKFVSRCKEFGNVEKFIRRFI